MQEKAHVLHILNLLKNTYEKNSPEEHPLRLPAYATLHLAHALRGVFYPATFTYPLTARFLLQRPELDADDVRRAAFASAEGRKGYEEGQVDAYLDAAVDVLLRRG